MGFYSWIIRLLMRSSISSQKEMRLKKKRKKISGICKARESGHHEDYGIS